MWGQFRMAPAAGQQLTAALIGSRLSLDTDVNLVTFAMGNQGWRGEDSPWYGASVQTRCNAESLGR
jgi:hypothetical protein